MKELRNYADENGDIYTLLYPDGETELVKVYVAEIVMKEAGAKEADHET